MPIVDFFRNLFGFRTQEPPQQRLDDDQRYRDSFRNPIWQTDEEEDDVSDFSSRRPRNGFQFRIFSDPFEITRFFENQMDEMLSNFFGSFDGFGNRFPNNGPFIPFGAEEFSNALPMPDQKPKGPRDEVMKSRIEVPSSRFSSDYFFDVSPIPDKNLSDEGPCDEVLKPSYEMPNSNSKKLDSDIDGKINSNELAKIWKAPSSNALEPHKPQFSFRTFGSSVSTQMVRRPDGSVEQRRTVRDSNGNEEITVTRQIGDKIHTVITKKATDGSEIKTEDIVNMEESELKGFDEKWTKIQIPSEKGHEDDFLWTKFFGPHPKL